MHKVLPYKLFVLILGLFFSCKRQEDATSLLAEARQFAEINPDSSMVIIDSIQNPEASLNREQYMQYAVTRVQVRYKNFQDGMSKDNFT